MSVEDAKRAVDIGASAVMVSNHGGRQLDGSVTFGIGLLTFLSLVITYCAYFLVHKGYKIKS